MADALREAVWVRASGSCERCGVTLGNTFALHHRLLRSRGGRDELPNLVALHHHCHNLGTDSVHLNPRKATEDGFMVPTGHDPRAIPIRLRDGARVYLTDEGGYLMTEDGREHPGNDSW
jgi:hypothetical protein